MNVIPEHVVNIPHTISPTESRFDMQAEPEGHRDSDGAPENSTSNTRAAQSTSRGLRRSFAVQEGLCNVVARTSQSHAVHHRD